MERLSPLKSMKTNFKRMLMAGALVATLPVLAGCVAVAVGAAAGAGAGTVAYVRGELQANLDAPLDRAVAAVNKTITVLKMTKTSETTNVAAVTVKAASLQDKTVTVSLKKLTDNATAIGIRIGTFGDQAQAQQFLDEVKRHL